mmetsp:Transcript_10258/g.38022  ORF Transcript_10258/g.38022 Transcript_10258/m.38022 type:complete len:242 (-) Transcript_10258:1996-2721(-)
MLGSSANDVGLSGRRAHCASRVSSSASISDPRLFSSGVMCFFAIGALPSGLFARRSNSSRAKRSAAAEFDSVIRAHPSSKTDLSSMPSPPSPYSATICAPAIAAAWLTKLAATSWSMLQLRAGSLFVYAPSAATETLPIGEAPPTSRAISASPGASAYPFPTAATAAPSPPQFFAVSSIEFFKFSSGNSSSFHRRFTKKSSVGQGQLHAPVSPFATMGVSINVSVSSSSSCVASFFALMAV